MSEDTEIIERRTGISKQMLSTLSLVVAIALGLAGFVKSMVLTPYRLDQIEKDHDALVLKTTAEIVAIQTKYDPMRDMLIRIEVELADIKRVLNRDLKSNRE